jgi:hypothetical protein
MTPQQALEEPLCGCTISLSLQVHINHFSVLVDGSPKITLLAIDLHQDLIDEQGIAETPMLSFQATCINGTEFDAPETDRFSANSDASLSEQIFNEWSGIPAVTQIEAIVEPDCVQLMMSGGNRCRLYVFMQRFHQYRLVGNTLTGYSPGRRA